MREVVNRREALAAAGVLGAAALTARADEPKKPGGPFRFHKPVVKRTVSLDPKAHASNVSEDGRALSLLFGDPKLGDLQIGLGEPEKVLSATKLVTFSVAVQAPADRSLVGFRQILQGYIQKGKGSRVVLVADLGGTLKVIEYPFGQEIAAGDNFVHAFFSPDVNITTGTEEVAPLPEYAGTLTLLVQTRSPKDRVLAAIDSLDVEALLTGAPANPAARTPAKKRNKPE